MKEPVDYDKITNDAVDWIVKMWDAASDGQKRSALYRLKRQPLESKQVAWYKLNAFMTVGQMAEIKRIWNTIYMPRYTRGIKE